MPFFTGHSQIIKNQSIISLKSTTLQVRIPCKKLKHMEFRVKRVFLFTSACYECPPVRWMRGSLTIEAAFSLTLMVFAMVVLMLPMRIMNTRRQLQAGLETVNEELCRYAYIKYRLDQGDAESVSGLQGFAESLAGKVLESIAEGYTREQVLSWADTDRIGNISMNRSSILVDGETLHLVMDYEIVLPYPVFSLTSIPQSVQSCRRAWIGSAGGIRGQAGDGNEEEDRIVYLGKGSTRYHDSRDCHYLSNQLQAVSREQVDQLRSESGRIYYPCAVCGAGEQSVVYIMPNGSRYHTQMRCSAIVAYVQAVKLSEAAYLGGCSYCVK